MGPGNRITPKRTTCFGTNRGFPRALREGFRSDLMSMKTDLKSREIIRKTKKGRKFRHQSVIYVTLFLKDQSGDSPKLSDIYIMQVVAEGQCMRQSRSHGLLVRKSRADTNDCDTAPRGDNYTTGLTKTEC